MGMSLKNYEVIEERLVANEVAIIRFVPKAIKKPYKTLIFYHGWGSDKNSQRIRGFLVATLGYQVIIPDAINHGERSPLSDYNDPESVFTYFWDTIFQNLEESSKLVDYILSKLDGDSNNLYVTGHSMGGFTAAGVFAHDERIKTAIPLNGSFNWTGSNKIFMKDIGALENLDMTDEKVLATEEKIVKLDPMNNLEKIINRPIKIIHGEKDSQVDINPQREFYNIMKEKYTREEDLSFTTIYGLDHFVTTNMMEELIKWIKRF